MKFKHYIWLIPLVCTSCFQEENPLPPYEPGDLQVGVAAMGPYYGSQVYYDLAGNMEVASNQVKRWDLSFESVSGGWEIRLNTSMFMYAGNSHDTVFDEPLYQDSLYMAFDASSGNPDSMAFGDWVDETEQGPVSRKQVYLVDLGSDEMGAPAGLMKVQFDISGDDYLVRYGSPQGGTDTTVLIQRDPAKRVIQFSFSEGVLDLEPPSDTWSLLFTRYTTMLITNEGEKYPYIVAGVLLNPERVSAARDTMGAFDTLVLADTLDFKLTTRPDVIGYSWKHYDFEGGFYTVVPGEYFIIKNGDGYFYKLRFLDFYNVSGEKGYPKFEFARL